MGWYANQKARHDAHKEAVEQGTARKTFTFDAVTLTVEGGHATLKQPGAQPVPVTAAVHATVETAGDVDRRVTATRLALAGPLAFGLRKVKDHRTLCLTVVGPDFAWVVEARNADRVAQAQRFAEQVNLAARRAADA